MSYGLYSERGYVADLASIEGWADVLDFVREQQAQMIPELMAFVEGGYTYRPQKVRAELGKLLGSSRVKDSGVRDTLKNLEAKLAEAREVAIVHG